MNRRNFLGGVGSIALGTAVYGGSPEKVYQTQERPNPFWDEFGIPSPLKTKVNIKPVLTNIVHRDVWEGPCRFTGRVSIEDERIQTAERVAKWKAGIRNNSLNFCSETVNVLEPTDILFNDKFIIPDEEMNKLASDCEETDVFLLNAAGSSVSAYEIGKRFGKPIIMVGLNCRNVDIATYSRYKGCEAFVPAGNDELHAFLRLFAARKAFRNTKILLPTDWGMPAVCSVGSIDDFNELERLHGITVDTVYYSELADAMNAVLHDRDAMNQAEEYAGYLLNHAERTFIDRAYVARSIAFLGAVRDLMKDKGCNAFSIECFEFCSSMLPETWKITPCLIHTLMKDNGFSSSCEADLGSLLAMRLLMSVSGKSCHQGNSDPREGKTFRINHSAPGIKMNGYDKPGLPYQLGRFVESGWGTKAVIDFMNNSEKTITVARIDPTATKMLVLKGTLVGSSGWDEDLRGCSVEALIKAPEGREDEFMETRIGYGNHLQWVYGDYTQQLQKAGELLNLKVELIR